MPPPGQGCPYAATWAGGGAASSSLSLSSDESGSGSEVSALEVSMHTIRSPASSVSLRSTATCVMTPLTGAHTAVSIFMALITTSCCPATTDTPGLTCTSMMVPAMGAPTLPSRLRSAFSRTAFLPTATSALWSTTSTTRGTPFASKNTSRLPLACSSPTALYLMVAATPFAISSSTSSSSSKGARNARVGSFSIRSLYLPVNSMYSSNTLGYMAALSTSLLLMAAAPNFSLSLNSIPSRSRGARLAPGRPTMEDLPLSTLLRSGSGKPNAGWPR
mmetsp:Transcript_18123/g.38999  ORF Transcript_18123/g.38999 Transcript_18123/m.38999 type:complete len:275 (+) Transcript_18123:671-1495(+)